MVFFILLSAVHYFDSIEKAKINGSKYSNCQDNSLINFSTHNRKDKIKIIYSSVFFLNHKKYLEKVILFRWKKQKIKKAKGFYCNDKVKFFSSPEIWKLD